VPTPTRAPEDITQFQHLGLFLPAATDDEPPSKPAEADPDYAFFLDGRGTFHSSLRLHSIGRPGGLAESRFAAREINWAARRRWVKATAKAAGSHRSCETVRFGASAAYLLNEAASLA